MAIQMRRGVFDRFDPSKLMPGEWAVVLSGDPNTSNGKAVYVCFAAGNVKRVATVEDAAAIIANMTDEIATQFTADVETALGDAATATTSANSAAPSANSAASSATAAAAGANGAAEGARAAASGADAARDAANAVAYGKLPSLSISATGNPVTTTDAANAPFLKLHVAGKSEQDGTSGKNLLNPEWFRFDYSEASGRGVTYSLTSDGGLRVEGTCTQDGWLVLIDNGRGGMEAGETYTVSCEDKSFGWSAWNNVKSSSGVGDTTFTIPENATAWNVALETVAGVAYDAVVHPQLEAGSTVTSYEPYTGGAPSPSPDYPQEIRCVRGPNRVKGSVFQNNGKTSLTDNGLTFTINDDGSITVNGTATATPSSFYLELDDVGPGCEAVVWSQYISGSYSNWVNTVDDYGVRLRPATDSIGDSEIGGVTQGAIYSYPGTSGEPVVSGVYHLKVDAELKFRAAAGDAFDNYTFRAWVVANGRRDASAYVPYGSIGVAVTRGGSTAVTPIGLQGHELHRLPDGTRDELAVDAAGRKVIVQRVGKKTFASAMFFTRDHEAVLMSIAASDAKKASSNNIIAPIICDKLSPATASQVYRGTTTGVALNTDGAITACLPNVTDIAGASTFLASNPVTVLYPLATPVTHDLGYIDPPEVSDGATVELLAEVAPDISAEWWAAPAQAVPDSISAHQERIENAIADLATSVAALQS